MNARWPLRWWAARGSWTRRLLAAGGVLVLVFVGALVGLRLWRSSQISAELARIRAAGEPVTPEDLNAMYQLPPHAEDATELWLKAIKVFPPFARSQYWQLGRSIPLVDPNVLTEPPVPGELWPELETADQFLTQFEGALREFHDAARANGKTRYPIDFRDGFSTVLKHATALRIASRLLTLQAHVRAHRGDADGAAKSINAVFAAARSLELEPGLVSQLVRASCDGQAIKEIQRLVGAMEFDDSHLSQFQNALRTTRYKEALHRAMLGERVMGLVAFHDPSSLNITGTRGILWRLGWSDDRLRYLKLMRRLLDATRRPWPEALQQIDPIAREPLMNSAFYPDLSRMRGVLTTVMVGKYAHNYRSIAHAVARTRAADAAIGVERYRRRHGRLPESLEELVPEFLPEVPEDPFDGHPLRYVVREGEYVVYSVGRDRVDDGGDDTGSRPRDITFRVRLRKKD